jgi:hypothetical protein
MTKPVRKPKFRWLHRPKNRPPRESFTPTELSASGFAGSLGDAIANAQLLINYAGAFGVTLESNILQSISRACELFKIGRLNAHEQATFFENYTALAKATYPVTVASLKSCTVEKQYRDLFRRPIAQTPADRILKKYRFYGIVALVILIIVQAYWVVGSFLVAKLPLLGDDPTKFPVAVRERALWMQMSWDIPRPANVPVEVLQQADAQHEMDDDNLSSGKKPEDNGSKLTLAKISRDTFFREQAILRAKDDTYTRFLDIWAYPGEIIANRCEEVFHIEHAADLRPSKAWISGVIATQVLSVLQAYVLPPLYGWLGAIAFVLRRLIADVNNRTYQDDSHTSYSLRLYLGVLAGLAVGWFFTSNPTPGGNVVHALSPLALAFLAGYSVELLFAAMDKLLEAFSAKSPNSKAVTP